MTAATALQPTAQLQLMTPTEAQLEWGELRPELERVLKKGLGLHRPEDVLLQILDGRQQLWRIYNDVLPIGYMVTEVFNAPLKRLCRIVYVVGSDRREMLKLLPDLEAWARLHDCDAIVFHGRWGWTNDKAIKKTFKVDSVLFAMELT